VTVLILSLCRLDVRSTGQRFKCMGGGYDMIGTCLGEWLEANYQARLVAIADSAEALWSGAYLHSRNKDGLYGMTARGSVTWQSGKRIDRVTLDGGCGLSCMERIAEAIGLSISRTGDRKGRTTGFMVTDYGSAEHMQALSPR
jgi:hypothetical protein